MVTSDSYLDAWIKLVAHVFSLSLQMPDHISSTAGLARGLFSTPGI
jgi:hypothetical protein